MRVAWLFEYPTMNGGERSLLATLDYLRRDGIEPAALAPAEGPLAEQLARRGVRHVPFDVMEGGRRAPRDGLRRLLLDQLKAIEPALLHANSLSMGRLSGPVAVQAGLPSIAHLRDIIGLSAAAVADLNLHTRLLAVSRATRDHHLRQGLCEDRTHICYNGVDLQVFRPRPATRWLHRRLGLPTDALLAATVGQIVMRKGHDALLRAAARVKERLPALHWLIIGERHSQKAEAIAYEADLRLAVKAARLSDRFHFLGALSDMHTVLPEVTLLIHPARQEPLGRVLLEAAAAGVACLATDVGGTREIFCGEGMARLAAPNDDQALATAMAELVASPAEREKIGQAARRRMEESFGIEQAAMELAGHYRSVSAQSR